MARSLQTPVPPKPQATRAIDRVVSLANGKGGVGKTTTAANVGGYVALAGSRVLLIDLDPQGDLARDLGYERHAPTGSAAYATCDAMTGANMIEGPLNHRTASMSTARVTCR